MYSCYYNYVNLKGIVMGKAYVTVLKVVVLVLVFALGMVSSIALLIGGGIYAANEVSLNRLEELGIKIDTSAIFDDSAESPIRSMTIIDLIKTAAEVSAIADTATFEYLSDKYGLILPEEGESQLFDAFRNVTFDKLFSEEGVKLAMDRVQLGELVGYEKRNDDWYNAEKNEYVWEVEAVLCDYTIFQLIYEGVEVDDVFAEIEIGKVFGYEKKEDGVWYYSDGTPVKGIMGVLSGRTLDNLEGAFDEEPMGNLLGFYLNEEDGMWYSDDTEDATLCEPIMQLISKTKFNEIDTIHEQIELSDLIPESERDSGYISLLDADTRLNDISGEVNRIFSEATLGQLVDCGALELTDEELLALELKPDLKNASVPELISMILTSP